MCTFRLFLSVDPSLGRVDYSSMSDQTLVEMLIDGFDDETKKTFQDSEGAYLDVCKCSGVECNDYERVIEIYVNNANVSGSVELCYIPM